LKACANQPAVIDALPHFIRPILGEKRRNAAHRENALVGSEESQRRREYLPESRRVRRIRAADEQRESLVPKMPTPIAERARIGMPLDDAVMRYHDAPRAETPQDDCVAFGAGDRHVGRGGDLALT